MPYHFNNLDYIYTAFNSPEPSGKITANSLLFQFSQFSDALLFQRTINQLEKSVYSIEYAINISLVVSSTDNKHLVNLFLLPQARMEGASVYTIIKFLESKNIFLEKVFAHTPDIQNPLALDPSTGRKHFNVTEVVRGQFNSLGLDFISFLEEIHMAGKVNHTTCDALEEYRPLSFRR